MKSAVTEQLAGQVLVVGFAGPEAPAELLDQARAGLVGGVILFRRNLAEVHGIAHLVSRLASAFPETLPPMVGVDQEGGRVERVREGVLRLPPMRALGALDDPGLCERAGRVLGQQLAALGFTLNFAPVLDVDTNPDNPVIGDRAFAATPERVIRLALPFADGLRQGGVGACGKHFPGHGDTDIDSHLALPTLSHSRDRLNAVELRPFAAARGRLDAIMSAHVVFPNLAPATPATHAPQVITGLLRNELGFDGLVVSDDLEMRAVADRVGIGESACLAIAAGCDTVLICSRLDWAAEARAALLARAHVDPTFAARLADASARSLSMRRRWPSRPVTDRAALDAALTTEEGASVREELRRRLES